MNIVDLLLSIPAEIVAVSVLSLLSGHDIVRFNSATMSQHARRPLWEALDMCAPVVLQVDEKQGFEVEYAAWEWFWKHSLPFVLSPNERSFYELAKLIGHENHVSGDIHTYYWGEVDSMTIARVFRVPKLMRKVSHLSLAPQVPQDIVLQNLNLFSNLASLRVDASCDLSEEMLVEILRGAAPLKELTSPCVLSVTSVVRDALMRHAPTLESAALFALGATSLNLYNFYAQCRNLRALHLYNGCESELGERSPIPASFVTAIATGCPKLRSVYLGTLESNCDAIHTFASHCPELQSIDGVSLQLTDAGLAALASNCADFSTLNYTVWEVTDESVVHATHLLLRGCDALYSLKPRNRSIQNVTTTPSYKQ
jgi:hypothetical protein